MNKVKGLSLLSYEMLSIQDLKNIKGGMVSIEDGGGKCFVSRECSTTFGVECESDTGDCQRIEGGVRCDGVDHCC